VRLLAKAAPWVPIETSRKNKKWATLQELPISLILFIFSGRDVSSTQLNGGSGLHNLQTAKVMHKSSDFFTFSL
jgi:hypothetical protein